MAKLTKEQLKTQLKAIKDFGEAGKKTAEEKETQYDIPFAYGWLRSTMDDVIHNIERLIEEV